jgi:hypothetical protein
VQVVTVHWPAVAAQVKPPSQLPQVPPQPSSPQTRPVQLGWQAMPVTWSRYWLSTPCSQSESGAPGAIVLSTSARWRMRVAHRCTSATVSKFTPSGAPWRAPPASVALWHVAQRCASTSAPVDRHVLPSGSDGLMLPVHAASPRASSVPLRNITG